MGCTTSSVSPANLEKVLLANNKPAASPNINAESSSLNSSSSTKDALIYTEAVDNSGNLFAAIKRGDLEASKTLIESMQTTKLAARAQPIVINQLIGMWNATPLIVAAQYGQKEIALELLKLSELGNLNHVNDKGASVLLYACMEGLVEIVKILLANHAIVSTVSSTDAIYNQLTDQAVKCTPLSIAVANGHQAIVALLLDAGADLNAQFPFPTTKSILRHPPNESMNSFKGSTRTSIRVGSTGAVNLTPVMLAACSGRINVLRELLWRKCNCSIRDAEESTLLHHIARAKSDNVNMYRELKKNAVSIDSLLEAKDFNGDTALIVACEGKQVELATMLLEDGSAASASSQDTGSTALHHAVKKKSIELVQVLLEYGADPLLQDKNKNSPFDLAMKLHKDSEIHKAILKAGTAWKELRGLNTVSARGAINNTPFYQSSANPTSSTSMDQNDIYNPKNDFGISYASQNGEVYRRLDGFLCEDKEEERHDILLRQRVLSEDSAKENADVEHVDKNIAPAAKINNFVSTPVSCPDVAAPTHSVLKTSTALPYYEQFDGVSDYASPDHTHVHFDAAVAVIGDSSASCTLKGGATTEKAAADLALTTTLHQQGEEQKQGQEQEKPLFITPTVVQNPDLISQATTAILANKSTALSGDKDNEDEGTTDGNTEDVLGSLNVRALRPSVIAPPVPQNSLRDVNYRESFVFPTAATTASPTSSGTIASPAAAPLKSGVTTSNAVIAKESVTITKEAKNGTVGAAAPGLTGSAAVAVASGIYRSNGSFKMNSPFPLKKETSGSFKYNSGSSPMTASSATATAAATVVASPAASAADGAEGIREVESTIAGSEVAVSAVGAADKPATRKSIIGASSNSFKSSPYTSNNSSSGISNKQRKSVLEKATSAAGATTATATSDINMSDAENTEPDQLRPSEETVANTLIGINSDSFATPKKVNMASSGPIVSQTASKAVSTPANASSAAGGGAGGGTGVAESKSALAPRRPSQAPNHNEVARSALRNSRYSSLKKESFTATAGTTAVPAVPTGTTGSLNEDVNKLDSEVSTPLAKVEKGQGSNANGNSLTPSSPAPKIASAGKSASIKRASSVKKPSSNTAK